MNSENTKNPILWICPYCKDLDKINKAKNIKKNDTNNNNNNNTRRTKMQIVII